jgi:hypothetical protein
MSLSSDDLGLIDDLLDELDPSQNNFTQPFVNIVKSNYQPKAQPSKDLTKKLNDERVYFILKNPIKEN